MEVLHMYYLIYISDVTWEKERQEKAADLFFYYKTSPPLFITLGVEKRLFIRRISAAWNFSRELWGREEKKTGVQRQGAKLAGKKRKILFFLSTSFSSPFFFLGWIETGGMIQLVSKWNG